MGTEPYRVLLYYRFTPVEDVEAVAAEQRVLCEELELRGRILVGREGINGTVSGRAAQTAAYMRAMNALPLTKGMEFKVDPVEGHVFPKLSVKVRDEVVTFGLEGEGIDPWELTGVHLSPEEFREAMENEDVVLLDGRNDYETALGRFRGAICPEVEHFREFPEWVRAHRELLEGKKILTYCTGGIRCEKLSGLLLREGFEEVYQLAGGIIQYGKDEATRGRDFEGLCYVFDERVGVEVNRTETRRVISRCRHCGELSARYRNCGWPECNAQFFCCEGCEAERGRYCSEDCGELADY